MKKRFFAGLIAGVLLIGIAGIANADLIINGSFETPELRDNSWAVFPSIEGWKSTSGAGIEIQNNVAGSSYDGEQHVELDSHNNSAMEQLVDTNLDEFYMLSFYYSPRPGVAVESNGIEVSWNNVLLGTTITGYTTGNTDWTQYSYSVMGIGGQASLLFSAVGSNDSFGGYLDSVSLTAAPVPEPATMLLFGTGLVGLIGARLKRKKK